MKRLLRFAIPSIWTVYFVLVCSARANEIEGKVAKADGKTITISSSSDLQPVIGDKLEVCVEIPGVGKASVATGSVIGVDGTTITASIEKATGRVADGQLVTITSPKPVRRAPAKVPIVIGQSAAEAKTAIEDAGFKAEVKVGIDAPEGVRPFTVYEQKPAATAELAAGGTVAITLYGGDPAKADPTPEPAMGVPTGVSPRI